MEHIDTTSIPPSGLLQAEPAWRVRRMTRAGYASYGLLLALVLTAATLPAWGDPAWMRELTRIGCYFVFAAMWNLLAGFAGMVSVGQQAFFGLGGYAIVALSNNAGLNPFWSVPLSALAAAAAAALAAPIAFRLHGGYFAIGTWALAELARLTIANMPWLGGGTGTSLLGLADFNSATREALVYWMTLAAASCGLFGVHLLLSTRHGLALRAIKDAPLASASHGINVRQSRYVIYVVCAGGAGLAGALYFIGNLRISPDAAFAVDWTAFAIFMVVVGGIGTIEGPLVGACLFWALDRWFGQYGTGYLIGLGATAILVTLLFPQGLWGWVRQRFGLEALPVSSKLLLPSARGGS
ncbi:branched-chain amino acid ABC transporter permease [Cupriavidus oxalaticus]|uniref:ABC-type branched-chain amino acid transport system, permease component n=2 Tax=Cupriavidus oxalaticus TaxID=96344 RepID=A0A375FLN3_9BURK|nr:branched-chain amino acid ABC transporter permease [Cupriavidus oxalaticus]WQD84481.1 branched-chain amino acid ABC transporter permease [Cupriavidus oxalaticus]SPC06607.1 ABC-type branched-chain amino acid transport system, permease component [Cupriavidus oxalaticus]SPC12413.1 ABC-type branched-chain amino acid transport system, permease component [Cupriavidus oxalaticus]